LKVEIQLELFEMNTGLDRTRDVEELGSWYPFTDILDFLKLQKGCDVQDNWCCRVAQTDEERKHSTAVSL
jgi:hypothetical protein